ncbi:MAG: UPF0149 family protein [Acidiferrobacterales bacterium]
MRLVHDELERLLQDAGAVIGASEVHGIVAGVMSTTAGANSDYLSSLFGNAAETALSDDLKQTLTALYDDTRSAFEDEGFTFPLLLADDTRGATERTASIAAWSRGFVLGLTQGGIRNLDDLPGDAAEIVRDLMKIGEARSDLQDNTEQASRDLAEIEEYVRVGVQLVYLELRTTLGRR